MEHDIGIVVTYDVMGNWDGRILSWDHPESVDERFMSVHRLPSRCCTRISR